MQAHQRSSFEIMSGGVLINVLDHSIVNTTIQHPDTTRFVPLFTFFYINYAQIVTFINYLT